MITNTAEQMLVNEVLVNNKLLVLSRVPEQLQIATSKELIKKIWRLRQTEFSKHYPGVTDFYNDSYDKDACILCSKNTKGQMISTGRIVFDQGIGLPADQLIKSEMDKLRQARRVIAEPSKFAITREARGTLPDYMLTYYEIAQGHHINSLVFICKEKSTGFYKKAVGANVLLADIGHSYGTQDTFSFLEWKVEESKPYLSRWLNEEIQ